MPENACVFQQSRCPVVPSSRCLAVPSSRSPVVSLSRCPAVPWSRRPAVSQSRGLAVSSSRCLVGALPSRSQSFSVVLSLSQSIARPSQSRAPLSTPNSYLIAPIYDLFSPFISQILKKIKKSCVRIFTDQNYFITLPRFCDERKPLAEEPQKWHPRISRWLSQIPRFLQTKRC